jgi:hypothetical protein
LKQVNKLSNRYIAILAVIALMGILIVPAVSAGKTVNYFPTQIAIKTIPVVKYTPTSAVVTQKTIPFTYSPSKGANTTLPNPTSDNSRANLSYIPTTKIYPPKNPPIFSSKKVFNQFTSNKNATNNPLISINPNDPAIQKIHDSTLLLLIDPNYRKTMDPINNQINALQDFGIWIKDPVLGDMVIIAIYLKPGSDMGKVDQLVYQVRNIRANENVIVATVPLENVYAIASLPEVESINIPYPTENS